MTSEIVNIKPSIAAGKDSSVEPVLGTRSEPRSPYVFPGLFKRQAITLISVDRRVNSEPLAMVLALKASEHGGLPLFGPSAAMPTVICHGERSGDRRADTDQLWNALHAAENAEGSGAASDVSQLRKLHQSNSEWDEWRFDVPATRERYLAQLEPGTLTIIDDLRNWMSDSATQEHFDDVAKNLDQWCQNGHTAVVFETETNEDQPSLKAALDNSVDVLYAEWDGGAPHELGGGCIIARTKKGYFDLAPRRFNFWFKVFRQAFEWGMEIRPDADPLGGKELQVYQRQMQVDSWLKDGIPQKEIAERLGLNAATISRDVKALKKKKEESWEP